MGIQHLNKLIRSVCTNSIKKIPLWHLRKKVIVIDTSIYLYRFAGEGGLIDGMYQMISILLHYGIIPVFIFDGKPPPEKKQLLEKRKTEKVIAENQYLRVKQKLKEKQEKNMNANTAELETELGNLKKQFIRITTHDINNVKELMKLFGVTYFEAHGEADELCAKLVLRKYAWAVMSEDMDMFVYGCSRVLRYLSLLNRTVMLYEQRSILKQLQITQKEFREICIISGTDYNISSSKKTTLGRTMKYFAKYKKSSTSQDFYEWLNENTNYIEDYCLLCSTYVMFDLQHMNISCFEKQKIMNGPININAVHKFLEKFNFVFV